ncbi:MAG TPA: hypothetical protein VF660_08370, partial [Actinomycetota bacterium]
MGRNGRTSRVGSPAWFGATSLAVLATIALAACASNEARAPTRATPRAPRVTIMGVAFSPATITVPRGGSVTWLNDDPIKHTLTSGRQAVQGVPGVGGGTPARPSGVFDATLHR